MCWIQLKNKQNGRGGWIQCTPIQVILFKSEWKEHATITYSAASILKRSIEENVRRGVNNRNQSNNRYLA
jgi:hypothetical protein